MGLTRLVGIRLFGQFARFAHFAQFAMMGALALGLIGVPASTSFAMGRAPAALPPGVHDPQGAPNDRSWVALHIFDTFYPMTEVQTFPEALSSLELIEHLSTRRRVDRTILGGLGLDESPHYGSRSSNGHYLVWIHFSDPFVAAHPDLRGMIGSRYFMFEGRDTDVFTAWSGRTNLVALLKEGVVGLARPVPIPGASRFSGELQTFPDAAALGDADYEGGWYLADAQVERLLSAFQDYEGFGRGYSFLRTIAEKPNAPWEPQGAQLVNGYNCGDFAYHLITSAGAVTRAEVEALKIPLWYPRSYYDRPLPLKGSGARGRRWLDAHPDAPFFPDDQMMRLGWSELLFAGGGVEFFDKRALVEEFRSEWLRLIPARIWEHTHAIEWLQRRADFRSKGIVTELLPHVRAGARIVSPERRVAETPANRYRLSKSFNRYMRAGHRLERVKLEAAGIGEDDYPEFRALHESLKDPLR